MDVRITCPICGQAEVDCLPDHLQSHSKQSLIDILLLQHQQIRRQLVTPNPSVHVISRSEGATQGSNVSDTRGGGGTTPLLLEFQPTSEGTEDGATKDPEIEIKTELSILHGSDSHEVSANSLLHIEFGNEPVTVASSRNQNASSKSKSQPVVKVEAKAPVSHSTKDSRSSGKNGQPTFILVDHGSTKPGPSRRRTSEDRAVESGKSNGTDNGGDVQPATSIIQYIIDESGQITDSPQEEPDSWILADGRTIPVYSSLTQVPAVAENTPSCTINVDISSKAPESETIPITVERNPSHSQMHLDLMTDEEIPPRGEISEYEESNASSILSEDSNLRPNGSGMFGASELRRSPATVLHEHNMLSNRKKKSAKTAPPQQYVCQECPQHQVFRSLFELAEHKFESHQSKSVTNTTTVTLTPPEEHILPELEHILPEKIRRQSQTEDFFILPDTKEEPQVEMKPPETIPTATASTSTTKKEYFCLYCNFTAKKKTLLAEHMNSDHEGKPKVPSMFECTYCGKIFQARTNLRKHLLIHKERKYSCPTCPRGFTSNFKLMEHIRVHTKIYPYKCTQCEKTYRTLSLLNHHIKMVHLPEGERPPKRKLEFYCSICHRILHSKRSYLNHTLLHHEKPMKCSFCSETFNRNSVLVRHIRVAHDPQYESKESKDCPICHKKLHPNSMIKHMRIHSNEKPYSCNVCGKYFRTYANLTSHSWSHTNVDKPHKCRQCSKSYLFKKNLENHMLVHKRRTMHFVCNECGVKFTHKVNMKRHLEEHFKEKSHVCKVCGKAFQRHYYLTEHERIHSGVKPFTCNICGKASTTKSNHRAHLKIHDARETGNQEG